MQVLVKALQGNASLKSLDVSYNHIGAEGARSIDLMLQTNQQREIERRNQFILTLG